MSEGKPNLDELTKALGAHLMEGHMERFGIGPTMEFAQAFNRLRFGRLDEHRRQLYQNHFKELIDENGPTTAAIPELRDVWALDTSQSLPHLDRLLDDAAEIMAERGGTRIKQPGAYRSYFQNILTPEDLDRYPSIMDFALSSEVLSVVSNHLGCILSETARRGLIRDLP